jgi:CRISPR-associated endonuclease/helicase Cas3
MTDVIADLNLWGKQDGLPERYPLLCHLLDTAASAGVLWDRWLRPGLRNQLTVALAPGDPALARRRMMTVAALHDIGKANPVFQGQTRASNDKAWAAEFRAQLALDGYEAAPRISQPVVARHEAVSLTVLHGAAMTGDVDPTEHYLAVATGGHHGAFHDIADNRLTPRELRSVCIGAWGEQQHAHLRSVLEGVGLDALPDEPLAGLSAPAALILVSGLLILADWTASEEASVSHGRGVLCDVDPSRAPAEWIAQKAEWFNSRLPQTLGVYQPIDDPLNSILGQYADTPSDLQRASRDAGGGLLLATYPTGDGKTEAALLRHAARTDEGLLFALPTRSTASAMMKRVRGAYGTTANAARLSHGLAALDTFYAPPKTSIVSEHRDHLSTQPDDRITGLHPQDWLDGSKRSLLAPVTVSTCDQVLASALRQAHSHLRLLAIANRHVVLDEVHTYDVYQTRLLIELLAWWGKTGTRVTLLSATLPTWQRNEFVSAYAPFATRLTSAQSSFPSHTLVSPDGSGAEAPVPGRSRRTYDLLLSGVTSTDPVAHHVTWARKIRCAHPDARIAIIVNMVDRAQQVAQALNNDGQQVIVLHSRMTAGHREQVGDQLQELIGKDGTAKGITVVGTQVIESSLDIDVDFMCTDLAPSSSLVQRAGRLWRKDDPARTARLTKPLTSPELVVHACLDAKGHLDKFGQAPYMLAEQAKTWMVLAATPVLAVPAGVQAFVDDAAYTWTDINQSGGTNDTQGQWMADALARLGRAREVAIPFTGPLGYLAGPTYSALVKLTNRSEVADTETRFVDRVSHTFVLIDPSGTTPHAWTRSLRELTETTSPTRLKLAKAATVPANGKVDRALWKAHMATVGDRMWMPRAALLRGLCPIDMAAHLNVTYDTNIGLEIAAGP